MHTTRLLPFHFCLKCIIDNFFNVLHTFEFQVDVRIEIPKISHL